MRPVNLKELVRHLTTAQDRIDEAKERNVMLLLAVDPRIPELLMGDRVRLRQVL